MNLDTLFGDDLQVALDSGLVFTKKHPTLDYTLYSYSKAAPYTEGAWGNKAVAGCRGLIADGAGNVIARPWGKFFNHNQAEAAPIDLDESVYIMDKLDGSLGIIYPTDTGYAFATRGSFDSEMAQHATRIWQERYAAVRVRSDYTFLFEIVYPGNRIVIDYAGMDDVILLGAVHIETGMPVPSSVARDMLDWPGEVAEVLPYTTYREALEAPPRTGAEGVVMLSAATGNMVKIKQEDYIKLHRVVSNLSIKTVWQLMFERKSTVDILSIYPDELEVEVSSIIEKIKTTFDDYLFEIIMVFESIKHIESRKDFAQEALKHPYSYPLFRMRDGQDCFESIMTLVLDTLKETPVSE